MRRSIAFMLVVALIGSVCVAGKPPASARSPQQDEFHLDVPSHPYDVIPCRPEDRAITFSILAYEDGEAFIDYANASSPVQKTSTLALRKGEARELVLRDLRPNSAYTYHCNWRRVNEKSFTAGPQCTFHTARAAGSTFTFTLTADSHLDQHTSAAVYLKTLAAIRDDHPDLHIDLGNAFMTDKHPTRDEAAAQYLAQRYYFSRIEAPLLLALGTHDGETGKTDDGTESSLAVWSNRIRTRYFPNPIPDAFYSANATPASHRGLPQNYYAFTWGDALFVVLDPFANTVYRRGGKDGWDWTLGKLQYDFLKSTLASSQARFKFVFIHNLLRGDQTSRGGVEFASFNEWGGKNLDGTDGFAAHRPGFELPVHQLLLKHHVTAVFRAHDNFYARQELDGIAYVMVPQPSFAGNDRIRDLQTYGYEKGTFLGNAGYLRVTVTPLSATSAYVRTSPRQSIEIADSVSLPPRP